MSEYLSLRKRTENEPSRADANEPSETIEFLVRLSPINIDI